MRVRVRVRVRGSDHSWEESAETEDAEEGGRVEGAVESEPRLEVVEGAQPFDVLGLGWLVKAWCGGSSEGASSEAMSSRKCSSRWGDERLEVSESASAKT